MASSNKEVCALRYIGPIYRGHSNTRDQMTGEYARGQASRKTARSARRIWTSRVRAPDSLPFASMSFGPESLRGLASGQPTGGQIDYRLARRHVVAEFKRGRLSRLDVCDAHPELLRAARNVGEATAETCPICEDGQLVLVSFAFGPRLPAHGRCVTSREELTKLARRAPE